MHNVPTQEQLAASAASTASVWCAWGHAGLLADRPGHSAGPRHGCQLLAETPKHPPVHPRRDSGERKAPSLPFLPRWCVCVGGRPARAAEKATTPRRPAATNASAPRHRSSPAARGGASPQGRMRRKSRRSVLKRVSDTRPPKSAGSPWRPIAPQPPPPPPPPPSSSTAPAVRSQKPLRSQPLRASLRSLRVSRSVCSSRLGAAILKGGSAGRQAGRHPPLARRRRASRAPPGGRSGHHTAWRAEQRSRPARRAQRSGPRNGAHLRCWREAHPA